MNMETEKDLSYQALFEKYEETIKLNRYLEKRIEEIAAANKQKENLLIQQSRLAAMGEMLASIGHQWRLPLNSLTLLIHDLKDALEYGEINDKYFDRFTRDSMSQITQMSETINDFRKFYKFNKEKTTFSIGDSIEEALSIFSLSLQNHGIVVQFEYRGQQMAYGVPNEYSQVVLNILTNARDAFVHKEIPNRKIIIKLTETNNIIKADFIDNAGGIDPAHIHEVFEPYFTTRPQGTGLGLHMSKLIVEKMNGSITVENTGHGARFSILLPKLSVSNNTPSK
ncbi:sensor histidine kinase [Neobacillus bataviensis]|uniref:sensor histidine kinase n=1 Tax=Neobacillus bataviensis TaxID=220685 RepID=UPI001CBD9F19|nr:HAMP domain-containing sensor histidine kinase [Neobacillus bataviensis]